ncbi:permease-like cell division protein FtsX [Streptosporangium sp. KLBMP 9127]|nr:permease-like cell division protein FtsX [Streptosporangium sp. KLBMP 9127]
MRRYAVHGLLLRWLRPEIRRRLVTTVMVTGSAVLILLGAGGAAVSRPGSLFPAPDWALPMTGVYSVFLCDDASENCAGSATAEEKRAIEERLHGLPEVADVEFVSRQDAYDRMVAMMPDEPKYVAAITVDGMQESFRGMLASTDQIAAFRTAIGDMLGVTNVIVFRSTFPPGMVDVAISLCPATLADACEGRGGVTWDQKRAVEERLSAMTGIKRIYYADEDYSRRLIDHMHGGTGDSDEPPGYEAYLIKVDDARAIGRIKAGFESMPGVASAH